MENTQYVRLENDNAEYEIGYVYFKNGIDIQEGTFATDLEACWGDMVNKTGAYWNNEKRLFYYTCYQNGNPVRLLAILLGGTYRKTLPKGASCVTMVWN